MDARRVRLEEGANEVAVEQRKALLERPSRRGAPPPFVIEAAYDLVELQRGLEGQRAHVLMRLHYDRAFYADPEAVGERPVERPRRHGKEFALPDPELGRTRKLALSLRPAEAGPLVRGRPPPAMGTPAARPAAEAMPDAAEFRDAPGGGGHPGGGSETLREVAG